MTSADHASVAVDTRPTNTVDSGGLSAMRLGPKRTSSERPKNSAEQSVSARTRLSLNDVVPVDVQVRNLTVSSIIPTSFMTSRTLSWKTESKSGPQRPLPTRPLLASISASLAPGTLTAIMGSSGSGKTTLLNAMSSRVSSSSRLSQSGSILFNSQPNISHIRSAYIKQTDVLLPALTAKETLDYAADLRLPSGSSVNDRRNLVDQILSELGLKGAANTRVDDRGGLSGGEKRRVSIGVQMLSNPSVLFLDEPTTGLDANSAHHLVQTLKFLAAKGRSIIMTIHQPRSEIWELFDNLILLSKGASLYSGPTTECLPWFEKQGFRTPPFMNPAEFLVDLAAVDNRTAEVEAESAARIERLISAWKEGITGRDPPVETTGTPTSPPPRTHEIPIIFANRSTASFTRQIHVMTLRTVKITVRDPMGMSAAGVQAILMGVCIGWIFLRLGRDQAGIRSREGFLYISPALEGYLFLVFEIYRLTIDIAVFDQEHSEGCVTALPFLLSRRLARLLTEDIPVPILYSAISYWMADLDHQPTRFLTFCGIMIVNHYIAVTCAMLCVVASRNFAGASLIANMVYTLQTFACGFFIQGQSIPIWLRWSKYVTYTYYVFGALCGNEFEDVLYECPFSVADTETNAQCLLYNGNYILQSLGFPAHWVTVPIMVSFCFAVLCYLASWAGLAFGSREPVMSHAPGPNTGHDLATFKDNSPRARSMESLRTLNVELDNLALELDQRSAWGRKQLRKSIFAPITARIEAGKLNIVMGPSGCGKTSLLNAIAHRHESSFRARYRLSGKLLFNGAEPSNQVIHSLVSYVSQDDNALLASLTVRETLHFAAALRLPSFMSKAEKHSRAEDVLLQMGLKDCANNLIGNEMLKGISGGEKRRVTIAVQILTNPRILLLDEPTSGLDAFTASSIIEVLHGLATEGRTIILSLHQSRSDLWCHFGNLLLLAQGGRPVYSGPAKDVIDYFDTSLGHRCPQNMNPADFLMDSITANLHQDGELGEGRPTQDSLADKWAAHCTVTQATTLNIAALATSGKIYEKHADVRASDCTKPVERPSGKARLSTPAELGAFMRERTTLATSLPILLKRGFINFRRQPPVLLGRTMQVVGLAVVIACFFAPLKSDYASIQTRVGFVQQIGAFYFVGMLQNIAVYPSERDTFYHEYNDRVCSVESFLITYTLLEVPFEIFSCLIYGLLADLAVGFPRTVELYFSLFFCAFGIVNCGESLGIVFNTLLTHHTGFALTITSILFSIGNVMEGIMSIHMPALFNAFNWISPLRYAVRVLGPMTLRGQKFTCGDAQRLSDGTCTVSTGEEVLQLYNLDVNPYLNLAWLAATIVVYRLAAYGVLRLARLRK